jgi:hypothetical protein
MKAIIGFKNTDHAKKIYPYETVHLAIGNCKLRHATISASNVIHEKQTQDCFSLRRSVY